jgi:hypothetical protein
MVLKPAHPPANKLMPSWSKQQELANRGRRTSVAILNAGIESLIDEIQVAATLVCPDKNARATNKPAVVVLSFFTKPGDQIRW